MPSGIGWEAVTRWADEVSEVIAGHQPAFHINILVHDPDIEALRLAALISGAGEDPGPVVAGSWIVLLEESLSGRVFRTGAPIISPDVSLDPDYAPRPGSRTKSEMLLPVQVDGRVVGVVSIEAPWISAFSIEDYDRTRRQVEALAQSFPADVWPPEA